MYVCMHVWYAYRYGEPYGENDVVGVVLNFKMNTIEFTKNNVSTGIAFNDLHKYVCVYVCMYVFVMCLYMCVCVYVWIRRTFVELSI